jgi:hypothetical protein
MARTIEIQIETSSPGSESPSRVSAPRKPVEWPDRFPYLLLGFALLVMIAVSRFTSWLPVPEAHLAQWGPGKDAPPRQLVAIMDWLASVLIYQAAALGAGLFAVFVAWQSLRRQALDRVVPFLAVGALFVVAPLVVRWVSGGDPVGWVSNRRFPMLDPLIARLGPEDATSLAPYLDGIKTSIAVGELAGALMAVCMAATLFTPRPLTSDELARVVRRFKSILYASAFFFVTATLSAQKAFALVFAHLANVKAEDVVAASDTLSAEYAYLTGALYTVLLATVYLPGIAYLRYRATALRHETPDAKPRDEWLAEVGLDRSWLRLAPQVLALALPAAFSPVFQLLRGLAP